MRRTPAAGKSHAPSLGICPNGLAPFLVRYLPVEGRHAVVGRALEHRQLGRARRDDRNALHCRRAGADDADALALETHRFPGPSRCEQHLAGKIVDARNVRPDRRRQAAGREDDPARTQKLAIGQRRRPRGRCLVETCCGDALVETDMRAEPEAIRYVICIGKDLGLCRVALAPAPIALQIGIERVGIVDAFDIAARTGITVPVPGAADIAPRLDARHREAKAPGGIDGIEARKARSDNEHVAVERDGWHPGGHFRSCHVSVFASAGRKNASMSRHIRICACVAGAKPAIVAKPWNSSG